MKGSRSQPLWQRSLGEGLFLSTGKGDMAVGKTLLDLLGVQQTTTRKPTFQGIVLTARRNSVRPENNRVNLFAMVPEWRLSAASPSEEIVALYGYESRRRTKTLCLGQSRRPNAQGLYLEVDRANGLLRERYISDGGDRPKEVAVWQVAAFASPFTPKTSCIGLDHSQRGTPRWRGVFSLQVRPVY